MTVDRIYSPPDDKLRECAKAVAKDLPEGEVLRLADNQVRIQKISNIAKNLNIKPGSEANKVLSDTFGNAVDLRIINKLVRIDPIKGGSADDPTPAEISAPVRAFVKNLPAGDIFPLINNPDQRRSLVAAIPGINLNNEESGKHAPAAFTHELVTRAFRILNEEDTEGNSIEGNTTRPTETNPVRENTTRPTETNPVRENTTRPTETNPPQSSVNSSSSLFSSVRKASSIYRRTYQPSSEYFPVRHIITFGSIATSDRVILDELIRLKNDPRFIGLTRDEFYQYILVCYPTLLDERRIDIHSLLTGQTGNSGEFSFGDFLKCFKSNAIQMQVLAFRSGS